MNKIFQTIGKRKPRKSAFDLSHERKMSMQMGVLVPSLVQEVVPGDKFQINAEILVRMAPMIAPIMHRVDVFTHYFFVPNRILWEEWEDFITGGEDGLANPVFPTQRIQDSNKAWIAKGTLSDYLGVPPIPTTTTVTEDLFINQLPYRAYQTIYNEYYRDQNLSPKINVPKDSSEMASADIFALRNRAWEKDYFTSALPWTQKGPEISSPLTHTFNSPDVVRDSNGAPMAAAGTVEHDASGSLFSQQGAQFTASIDNTENLGITINDLRKSARVQEWLETNARAGSRYIESILAHFGVKSSDARLQRPEYLGGGKTPVVVSEVLQTSQTTKDTAEQDPSQQGNMAGHGISVGHHNRWSKGFEEHGYIIGIVSVLPKTAYQQGLDKHWLKVTDKFDYYWPEFAHLGEQEVKQNELFHDWEAPSGTKDGTFGYQQRYAEYKYARSSVHGDFRDNLAYWHMGRIFETTPALNSQFVESDPTQRVFAVTDETEHKLYVQMYNKVQALRPMPYHSIPTL